MKISFLSNYRLKTLERVYQDMYTTFLAADVTAKKM